MAVGPVDVYIIGFPGNKFTGRIAPAILDLVEEGTIRVLDLLFVSKDADGVVTSLRATDIDEAGADFQRRYLRLLQEDPAVAVAHAEVRQLIQS